MERIDDARKKGSKVLPALTAPVTPDLLERDFADGKADLASDFVREQAEFCMYGTFSSDASDHEHLGAVSTSNSQYGPAHSSPPVFWGFSGAEGKSLEDEAAWCERLCSTLFYTRTQSQPEAIKDRKAAKSGRKNERGEARRSSPRIAKTAVHRECGQEHSPDRCPLQRNAAGVSVRVLLGWTWVPGGSQGKCARRGKQRTDPVRFLFEAAFLSMPYQSFSVRGPNLVVIPIVIHRSPC